MKVVLPTDTIFVQINRVPVELCVCRKDLKFNAILNHHLTTRQRILIFTDIDS